MCRGNRDPSAYTGDDPRGSGPGGFVASLHSSWQHRFRIGIYFVLVNVCELLFPDNHCTAIYGTGHLWLEITSGTEEASPGVLLLAKEGLTISLFTSIESDYPYCQTYTFPDKAVSMVWCGATSAVGVETLLYQPGAIAISAKSLSSFKSRSQTDEESEAISKTSTTTLPLPTTTTKSPGGTSNSKSSGLSQENQIALGVGIGFGIPTTAVSLYLCYKTLKGRGKNVRLRYA